jgi:hypothetical protein
MLGLRLKGAGPWYGFIEGGKVSTYMYNHKDLPKRYLINEGFIGSPLGPDQRLLWGKLGRRFLFEETIAADLNFWFRHSGERNIDYVIETLQGTKKDPQPFGIIEMEHSYWGAISYSKYNAKLELNCGFTTYTNRGNKEMYPGQANFDVYPFFGIYLTSGISVRANRD